MSERRLSLIPALPKYHLASTRMALSPSQSINQRHAHNRPCRRITTPLPQPRPVQSASFPISHTLRVSLVSLSAAAAAAGPERPPSRRLTSGGAGWLPHARRWWLNACPQTTPISRGGPGRTLGGAVQCPMSMSGATGSDTATRRPGGGGAELADGRRVELAIAVSGGP